MTPFRSAQALNGKIATLSQDMFRIQANCNGLVTEKERVELTEDFCDRLQASGYPYKVAAKIVRNGLLNYVGKVEKAEKNNEWFHRPEEDGQVERRISKMTGRSNWFRPRRKTEKLSGVDPKLVGNGNEKDGRTSPEGLRSKKV